MAFEILSCVYLVLRPSGQELDEKGPCGGITAGQTGLSPGVPERDGIVVSLGEEEGGRG